MNITRSILETYLNLTSISDAAIRKALNAMGISARLRQNSVFCLEIPENRPDLLGFLGISRVLGACLGIPVIKPDAEWEDTDSCSIFQYLDVDVPAESCLRLSAKMAVNCHMGSSPEPLRKILQSLGIAPRKNLQDLAAWVTLESGVPVDVWDLRCLRSDGLILRDAFPGEEAAGIPLPAGSPVFSDPDCTARFPAGVTAPDLQEDSTDVVFLCGVFDPSRMEALPCHAFHHKALDPMATVPALERLCHLVQTLGLGEIPEGTLDNLNYVPQPRFLPLPGDLKRKTLEKLQILGFIPAEEGLEIPSFRQDIREEADLSLEIQKLSD